MYVCMDMFGYVCRECVCRVCECLGVVRGVCVAFSNHLCLCCVDCVAGTWSSASAAISSATCAGVRLCYVCFMQGPKLANPVSGLVR